jgi:hypothetical protein
VFEAAVVFTVKTLVPVPPEVIVTLAGFNLQVGRLFAPEGEAARVQVRFMVPAYVVLAVRVTVALALAPGETAGGVGALATTGKTATVVVPVAVAYIPSPA